jgi:hypothetical protein
VRSVLLFTTRACLVGVLSAGLLTLPVTATTAPYVGVVASSNKALLSGVNAAQGVDIYAGDELVTQPGGSLRLAAGSNQMALLASTKATILRDASAVCAKVQTGTVQFSTTPGQLEVDTPLGIVQGIGDGRAFGQVSVLSQKEIIVRAVGGTLTLNTDGEIRTVAEGTSYRFVEMSGEPAEPQGPQGYPNAPKTPRRHKKRKIAAFVIVGGTALAAYFIYRKTAESPTTLAGTP